MERVRVENVTQEFPGAVKALDNVSFSIEKGEWLAVMGPSGSGKTTLMNLIGLLDAPTTGRILLDGVDVSRLPQKRLTRFRREKIGFVFQQFYLIPYLTAVENVMVAQHYHSMADAGEAKDMLEMVGLGHRMNHLPSQLSGGEQQRVCIARALINDPVLLLADEPTGSLDQENEGIVLELFKKLHAHGHTLVVVTHDVDVGRMAERRIVLSHGHLVHPHPAMGAEEEYMDELLEILGKSRESLPAEGLASFQGLGGLAAPLLRKMERDKLVIVSEGRVSLTDEGVVIARERVRRHRLAEALFMGVIDQGPVQGQETACRFEHLLNASMADSICSFLRHPRTCPHGKPIPSGPCCKERSAVP